MTAETDPTLSPSGIPLERIYGPDEAGRFPFTRGIHPDMYRGRRWTMRQYSGFGSARLTNERYRFLLEQGGTGLSVALDLPSQIGYDSDDPDVEEEVGRVGVAIDTLADMEVLFEGIPLDSVSTSFTINGTAAVILAMYVAAAEKRGVAPDQIRGTIQNDILKEYVSRGTWIFPPEPSLRLIVDTIEFCLTRAPRFNPISVAGAHFRDAGRHRCPGARVHAGRRDHVRRALHRARPRRRRGRPPALVLLLHALRFLRGGREVPCRPAALGQDHARALRRQDRPRLHVPYWLRLRR